MHSINENNLKSIKFSIPRTEATNKHNTRITYQDGLVYVEYDFDFPILEDVMIIPGSASLNGIFLQIIETGDTEIVKEVGYEYTRTTSRGGKDEDKTFPVFNTPNGRYAFINQFENKDLGQGLDNDFNDEIYLFDENKKQIGHMYYEYEYKFNKDHVRNAILILHNDDKISHPIEDGGVLFPYTRTEKEDIFPGWKYYEIGEYPVSMLIPPLNKFPKNYNKKPILLLHGLNGVYKYTNRDELESEDVSYWYTTPRILNNIGKRDAWQMYYPNTGAVLTIAECLKFDLSHLKSLYSDRIKLVTHSYGGIISRHYLVNNVVDAKNKIEKVLFMAPPFYGSHAAIKAYYEWTGDIAEVWKNFLGEELDNEGLCNRDAALGSDVIRKYWNKPLPSLNNNSDVYDDYFVVMGTTNSNYELTIIHEEAFNHCDGAVAMSSASLLDKNIGFATIPGNHDDLVYAQADLKGKKNINRPNLIPKIIDAYFSEENTYDKFLNTISNYSDEDFKYIKAIVKHDKSVIKPDNINKKSLEYLETSTHENYQMSLLNFEILNFPRHINHGFRPLQLFAYYNEKIKELFLSENNEIQSNYIPYRNGYNYIGKFVKNEITNIYYFQKDGNEGCALDMLEGPTDIFVNYDNYLVKNTQNIEVGYCQSHFVSFDWNNKIKLLDWKFNGKSGIKYTHIPSSNSLKSSSKNVNISVDDQTSQTIFLISAKQSDYNSLTTHILQPNGAIYDNTEWLLDTATNLYSIKVDNPMPGTWQVWAEDSALGNDTLWYQTQALFQSDNILYNANEQQIDISDDYKLTANVVMPDKSRLSEIALKATIISPNGAKSEVDFGSNSLPTDSSYVYSVLLNQDTIGIYSISIECTGVYDSYNFERVVSSQIEVIDRTPYFYIPDIYLDGLKLYEEIKLEKQVYCQGCNSASFTYSYNILINNDILIDIDSSSTAFIASNFKDTNPSIIEFVVKENEQVVCRDTVSVYKNLPDLKIQNFQISDTGFVAGKNISISFDIFNDGNSYTNNTGKIGLALSKDGNFDKTDMLLSSQKLQIFSPYDTAHFTKEIVVPGGISLKYPYLLVIADIDSLIYESDKANNILSEEINVTVQTNFKKMVTVNEDNGELSFTDPNPFLPSSISYSGYDVTMVPWLDNNYIWAYASGNTLPAWVNYQFNIDNYENLDSVNVVFRGRGTTSDGIFYSYLYQQINNVIVSDNKQQLINSSDWTTYGLMLPKSYFNEGINQVKIGTSAGSQTYVALNGIAVEFYYKQSTVVVNTDSPSASNKMDIQIYPNPVNDALYLNDITEATRICIYDLNGNVSQAKEVNSNRLDVSNLSPGIYVLKIVTSETTIIKKIVKY